MLIAAIAALDGMGAMAVLLRPEGIGMKPIDMAQVKDGKYIGVYPNRISLAHNRNPVELAATRLLLSTSVYHRCISVQQWSADYMI